MLGVHHAGTSAAAWVALTAPAALVPSFEVWALPPHAIVAGAIVTAGAGLLPDADHHSATISYSMPGGKLLASAIGAAAGGHRHGTHAPIVLALMAFAAWWLIGPSGWVDTTYGSTYVLTCGIASVALIAFAVKVLKIVRGWPFSWLAGLIVSGVISFTMPDVWAWFPLMVVVGCVAHCLGDFLTTGGLPFTWPFKVKPPKAWSATPLLNRVWTRGGYVAFPILGNTGSWREQALAVPLTLYAAYGMGVALVSALPG